MNRLTAKIVSIVVTFFVPLICTLLPLKVSDIFLRRGESGRKILSSLMCFGGGVFFATYMLHMGPEVRLIIGRSLEIPYNIQYPIADLIMACGFFIVLFMEKFAVTMHTAQRKRKQCKLGKPKKCDSEDVGNGNCPCEILIEDNKAIVPKSSLRGPAAKSMEDLALTQNDTRCVPATDAGSDHHHDDDPHATRSIVLMLALSFHRIFEGMSVGLQNSSVAIMSLMLAVMCHESVIGFSLGLQLVKNHGRSKRAVIAVFLCSLIMPLGVGLGTVISEIFHTEEGGAIDIVNGVLQALATGTFIYVTFFEILQEELHHHGRELPKLLSLLFGFVAMAAVNAVPENTGVPVSPTEDLLNTTMATIHN